MKHIAVFDLDDGKGGYSPGNARLINISVWGACIATTVPLKQRQQIRGRVRSVAEGYFTISGHVAWRKKKSGYSLYGIAFDQITRISA